MNTNIFDLLKKLSAKLDKLKELQFLLLKMSLEKINIDYLFDGKLNKIKDSKPNTAFKQLLKLYKIPYLQEFKLEKYRYDFKVGNILIEINPTATHNSVWSPYLDHKGLSETYHLNKSLTARKHGFRCIHVFDWDNLLKIINLLKPREYIQARKCAIKEVQADLALAFINRYSIESNNSASDINIGLYYKDELVFVMAFNDTKNGTFELTLICSNKYIPNGEKRLFGYFFSLYLPIEVISYNNDSKFNGNYYKNLGFELILRLNGTPYWYNIKTKLYTKGDMNLLSDGYLPVYDAGISAYKYKKQ